MKRKIETSGVNKWKVFRKKKEEIFKDSSSKILDKLYIVGDLSAEVKRSAQILKKTCIISNSRYSSLDVVGKD